MPRGTDGAPPRCTTLAVCAGAWLAGAAPAVGMASDDTVHPDRWPQARSAGLMDAATEARVTALLEQMTLEEKVGQIIQTDIGVIEPDELRRYPLGSVLAGADSGVHGNKRAPATEWLTLTREFR